MKLALYASDRKTVIAIFNEGEVLRRPVHLAPGDYWIGPAPHTLCDGCGQEIQPGDEHTFCYPGME